MLSSSIFILMTPVGLNCHFSTKMHRLARVSKLKFSLAVASSKFDAIAHKPTGGTESSENDVHTARILEIHRFVNLLFLSKGKASWWVKPISHARNEAFVNYGSTHTNIYINVVQRTSISLLELTIRCLFYSTQTGVVIAGLFPLTTRGRLKFERAPTDIAFYDYEIMIANWY